MFDVRWPWQRKQERFKPFDRSALPEVQPAPFEEMVHDGLLMAESAARLALKNRFVVQALRGDEPYDPARARAAAREVLYELIRESDETSELSADEREAAAHRDGRSKHQHDYHRADALNLRRREKVYAEISNRLAMLRDDDIYLTVLAVRARDAAWDEVGAVIERALDREWPVIEIDAEYELARDERLRELNDDLARELGKHIAKREMRDELDDAWGGWG
ncbi:hypothetical protein ET445_03355 [Agromyces protaetiae]|uniref:Asparagine synthase n=1 Tax=Agromyces protaetiae TaxID=2509455 RepID=A0A4V0YGV4_9MICO|nr:hypothetical protein [Agromyces protaetiae]QAY72521.1 hypothetical protein ET445_03355 [Agromyces protaetiae]